ncbi:MAG: fatty acid desaturase [Leptothrix sp. (in: b-proteobacteria)]
MTTLYRYDDGRLPNTAVLAYVLLGWPLAIALLVQGSALALIGGGVLLAHGLVTSAYLLHEFAHLSIFKSQALNLRFGALMSWINGSCYARFADLRNKHMRHHVDRADVITFDTKAFLNRHPALRTVVLALEWLHLPAVEWLMHGYVMAQPFTTAPRADQGWARSRVVATLAIRAAAFAALGAASPAGLLVYALAYTVMLVVLRFTDAYQHTYDAFAVLEHGTPIPADKVRDRAYEQTNTYSNLVSVAHPALNLLLLNFSYHNAHHERPIEPWYKLPALHARLYPGGESAHHQTLPMRLCLKSFHQHRLTRVISEDYGVYGDGPTRADGFYGAVGVSFLTAV